MKNGVEYQSNYFGPLAHLVERLDVHREGDIISVNL